MTITDRLAHHNAPTVPVPRRTPQAERAYLSVVAFRDRSRCRALLSTSQPPDVRAALEEALQEIES